MKSVQSICINKVREILVLLVVIFHTFSIQAIGFSFKDYPITNSFRNFIESFFGGNYSIVAIYFFISGYLFYITGNWTKETYLSKLKNRARSLLLPYIIWNTIAILFVIIKSLPIFNIFLSYPNTSLNLSIRNILSCFWMYNGQLSLPPIGTDDYGSFLEIQSYPINTALWYIRDLMIVVLFTPIIHFFLKKMKYAYLLILGVLYAFLTSSATNWHYGQLSTAFLFFSIGAYFSINKIDFLNLFQKNCLSSIVIYLICSIGLFFIHNTTYKIPLYILHSFVMISLIFNIAIRQQNKSDSDKWNIGSLSVFIYMSHCIIIPRIFKIILFGLAPHTDVAYTFSYLLTLITTLGILSVCYYIIQRYTPSLMNILIGRK